MMQIERNGSVAAVTNTNHETGAIFALLLQY